jgi:hypothetical protein
MHRLMHRGAAVAMGSVATPMSKTGLLQSSSIENCICYDVSHARPGDEKPVVASRPRSCVNRISSTADNQLLSSSTQRSVLRI